MFLSVWFRFKRPVHLHQQHDEAEGDNARHGIAPVAGVAGLQGVA